MSRLPQRIDERIADRHHTLTPQERLAAAIVLEHLDDLATYRASELAELAGVSRATMTRLFRSLGFASFEEVREHLRGLRTAGEPGHVEGAPDAEALAAAEHAAILRAVEHPRLPEVAGLIALANRVLVGLGPEDVVVIVGFRRRPARFAAFLNEARDTGAVVVLVADQTAVAHASQATVWLECPLQQSLAFDSYAAPMALASVLADAVLAECGRAGSKRVRTITEAYERLGELE